VKDGATTGKTSFVTKDFSFKKAVVNEHVFLLRCSTEVLPSYIFRYLWSKEGQRKILANFQGAAQGGINRKFVANTTIPILPLNEQKRIVAKLDHLMPKIEAVNTRLDRIPQIIKRFRQSVLTAAVTGKLTEKWRNYNDFNTISYTLGEVIHENPRNGYSPKSVKYKTKFKSLTLTATTSGVFQAEHFKLEAHYQKAKAKVEKLPQSVLAKAFRGELVPQDPNDEPVEKLLERIKAEKVRLEKKGKKV
jgi:type I restriction enzyme S subunit